MEKNEDIESELPFKKGDKGVLRTQDYKRLAADSCRTEKIDLNGHYLPYYAKNPKLAALLYYDVKPALEKLSAVDVCFVCDITGDMDKYFDTFKKAMDVLTRAIASKVNSKPRVAFIGFRDIDDGKNQIVKHDFTLDTDKLKEFVNKIECSGGFDKCEDLVKPLREVLSLDWRSDMPYVYLLLEAPTHGRSYHTSEYTDNYKNEDKKKMVEKLACHYRKNKISLIILRCNSSVDMTIEKIREYYDSPINKLEVIDISTVEENAASYFADKMIGKFDDIYYKDFRRVEKSKESPEHINMSFNILLKKDIEFIFYKGRVDNLLYEKLKPDYKFSVMHIGKGKCEISSVPITAGLFSGWNYMKLKERDFKSIDYDQFIFKMNEKPITDRKELEQILEANTLADYFVLCFNALIREHWIDILPIFIVEVANEDNPMGKDMKYFIVQKYVKGYYVKFNNNYGWALDHDMPHNHVAPV